MNRRWKTGWIQWTVNRSREPIGRLHAFTERGIDSLIVARRLEGEEVPSKIPCTQRDSGIYRYSYAAETLVPKFQFDQDPNCPKVTDMSEAFRQPVRVFSLEDDFREPDLESLLCHDDVRNLRVVVISVAGRYRQGKSFLLNFMIRFLRAGGKFGWAPGTTDELRGFEWKNTRHRVTNGVLIWPEVFKLTFPNGETVAVILMDTQGVFDTETTVKDSTSIFSFSVLLSSVQIFNLKQQINGDDLSHLELFSEYGKLLLQNSGELETTSKIFQDIVFLIRDWSYASTVPYGWAGGKTVLEEEMNKTGLEGELQSMRRNIKNSFESYRCFLMPYPGDAVNTSGEFRGNFRDIKMDFLLNMEIFLQGLLTPENLVPKKINGNFVTLQEWCSYLGVYGRHLRSANLPVPKTLFEATLDATNTTVLNACTDFYFEEMVKLLEQDCYEEHILRGKHRETSEKAVATFRKSLKMGDQKLWRALEAELLKKMENLFENQFLKVNQNRLKIKQIELELAARSQECERIREQAELQKTNNEEVGKKIAQLEAESLVARQKLELARVECEAQLREAKSKKNWFTSLIGGVVDIVKSVVSALIPRLASAAIDRAGQSSDGKRK